MELELLAGVPAVGVIVGLVQLMKSMGFPSRYAGVLAVVLGLASSFAHTFYADSDLYRASVLGLMIGLSASGLWSTGKHVINRNC